MTKIYKDKRELIEDVVSGKVLDVGFWGQAVAMQSPNWPHRILEEVAGEVWGVDLKYDGSLGYEKYYKSGAEDFHLPITHYFDYIFAGDIIEHLSNPGLFLDRCAEYVAPAGKLVITTPNCFNLFSMAEKLIRSEPSVNPDHTMYFNHTTIKKLLEKNDWKIVGTHYIRTPKEKLTLSKKRSFLYLLDNIVSLFTPKFSESIVVIAGKNRE